MVAVPLPTDGLSIHQQTKKVRAEQATATEHQLPSEENQNHWNSKIAKYKKWLTESCNVCLTPLFEFQFMMLRSAIANSLDWMWPGNLGNWGKGQVAHLRTTYPARWHTYCGSQPSTPPHLGHTVPEVCSKTHAVDKEHVTWLEQTFEISSADLHVTSQESRFQCFVPRRPTNVALFIYVSTISTHVCRTNSCLWRQPKRDLASLVSSFKIRKTSAAWLWPLRSGRASKSLRTLSREKASKSSYANLGGPPVT